MSLDVLTAIWRAPPCKGGDLLCLLAIADNADENGYAWPSIRTIAKKAAMGERGAQKCIKKLEKEGLISIKIGGGRSKTNAYQITTNGIGDRKKHQNTEQNTLNTSSSFTGINPEQSDINPEPAFHKPRTPVHPNSQEPPLEPEDTYVSLSKPAKISDDITLAIQHFNAVADRVGWPRVQKLTPQRRSSLLSRFKDVGGVAAWCEAINRASRSPLLVGNNSRQWIASFDWLAKPANFTKLMEGNYDPRGNSNYEGGNGRRSGPHNDMVAAFAQVAANRSGGIQ